MFSSYYRFSFLLILVSLAVCYTCAPVKPTVEDSDLDRVVERMAERKVQVALNLPPGKKLPGDWALFREVCEIYRLDPESALESLKSRNPDLAVKIKESQ